MIVTCPKCKTRLKVAEEKISSEGTRFKCPKCSTVLLVRKPLSSLRHIDKGKVLVAVENTTIRERINSILKAEGYSVINALDGMEAIIKTIRELPFLAVLGLTLPKVYGTEACKRLKTKPETKDIKIILISALYDTPISETETMADFGADSYIDEQQLEDLLMDRVDILRGTKKPEEPESAKKIITEEEPKVSEKSSQPASAPPPAGEVDINLIDKARRLARTIISDIYLYNRPRVDEAIRNNNFSAALAHELNEGIRHYETKIPEHVRAIENFFTEAVNNFLLKKKEELLK
ncbi:MAG: response regulator [Nitrospirota bacterium]